MIVNGHKTKEMLIGAELLKGEAPPVLVRLSGTCSNCYSHLVDVHIASDLKWSNQ